MRTPAAAALLSALISVSAQADIPIDRYEHLKQHSDKFASYIQALGRGILLANEGLRQNGQQPLFCLPEQFLGDKYDMMRIIESGISRHQQTAPGKDGRRLTVEDIAIDAFRSAYPCEFSLSSR